MGEKKNDIWDIIATDKLWNYVLIPPDEEMIKNLGKCAALIKHLEIWGSEQKVFSDGERLLESGSLADFEKKDADGKWKMTKSLILSVQLMCKTLDKLTISNSVFDSKEIKLDMFPPTIRHLRFSNVSMPVSNRDRTVSSVESSPFFKIQGSFPAL